MKKGIATMLLIGMTNGVLTAPVELVVKMEITSESPLLQGEGISGTIRLTNNGTEAVKLVKDKENFWFVFAQVRFFIDLPMKDQERAFGYPLHGIPYGNRSREEGKKLVDSVIDKQDDLSITLSAGQSCEFRFEEIDFDSVAYFSTDKRLPLKAELYVQPDHWIPITITPPLEFAKDAKSKSITPDAIVKSEKNPFYVSRVSIGTTEFLRVSGDGNRRLIDLSPGDQVEQSSNTRITITHKDGTKTEITTDKVDDMVKQRHENRLKRLKAGQGAAP